MQFSDNILTTLAHEGIDVLRASFVDIEGAEGTLNWFGFAFMWTIFNVMDRIFYQYTTHMVLVG